LSLSIPFENLQGRVSFVSTSKAGLYIDKCIYVLENINKYGKSNPSATQLSHFQENESKDNLK
jgi:hypothetical protein